MRRCNRTAGAIFGLVSMLIVGCTDPLSGGLPLPCRVSCTSELYENPLTQGLGGLFMGMGNCLLMESRGFAIYEGHAGGYGDTLEWVGCEGGVRLVWAYNGLRDIYLSEGWQGSTDKGIEIGDSLDDVRSAYPNAVDVSNDVVNAVGAVWYVNGTFYELYFVFHDEGALQSISLWD